MCRVGHLRGLSKLEMRMKSHIKGVIHMEIQNMRLSCDATTGRSSIGKSSGLSNFQSFAPSSRTSFHQRSPTSRRPVTFWARGQAGEAEGAKGDAGVAVKTHLHCPEIECEQENGGHVPAEMLQ